MLRVAYLFERFPSFGQTFCYREVAELIRQGAEVSIFSIRRPTGESPQDWDDDVVSSVTYLPDEPALLSEITRLTNDGKLPTAASAAIKKWGRQTDFLRLAQAAYIGPRLHERKLARVHAHFAGMAARTAYWIREFFAVEYSLTVHANDIFAPRDFAVSLAMLLRNARAIVTESDFAARDLQARFPEEAEKVRRVYNGVDAGRFRLADFEADPPVIIAIARLIPKKGLRTLVAACARLQRSGRRFRCEIVGEGPLLGELMEKIRVNALEGVVQLLGPLPQTQIVDRLAGANVFALPCTKDADGGMDNLPTVIMEAMASGLPVVSTKLAGIPEMVEPGVTGTLVAPDDPAALADAIGKLLGDPAEARRLGVRGRERALERFALEPNVRALAEILTRT